MAKWNPRKPINHHIVYPYSGVGKHTQEAIEVKVFASEHWILSQLQRRGKNVSKGFLDSLKYFIWERETTKKYEIL